MQHECRTGDNDMARQGHDLSSAGKRKPLSNKRTEPFWTRIERNLHLGFRKRPTSETWIARYRDDAGNRWFQSIGPVDPSDPDDYDRAVKAARKFKQSRSGGSLGSDVKTVADACAAYVTGLRAAKREAAATDAEGRFARTVDGHAIGKVLLSKIKLANVEGWLSGLDMSDAGANRYLTVLKAALNYAVRHKHVSVEQSEAWKIKPKPESGHRELTLDYDQRQAMIAAASDDRARAFIKGLSLLPVRPQALANLTVKSLNGSALRIGVDKGHPPRTIEVAGETLDFIRSLCKDRPANAPMFEYDDKGRAWNKERWKKPIKQAAKAAKLEKSICERVCAYTFRHSTITDLVTQGANLRMVAHIAGTSVLMIQKHYGHINQKDVANALAGLARRPADAGQG
jgi:site-specific recombinase XerD